MKQDLSSQILLEHISGQYYLPKNEIESSVLTRFEKIPVEIFKSEKEASLSICKEIFLLIKEKQAVKQSVVLTLAGENSMQTIYREFIRVHQEEGLSFENVIIFNLYEYFPLEGKCESSFNFLKSFLIDYIDIPSDQIHTPNGQISKEDVLYHCLEYEKSVEKVGGIDFILLGLSKKGNIGINLFGANDNSFTRFVVLDIDSRKEAADTIFKFINRVPVGAITMGLATIMRAKKIGLIAFGEEKSESISQLVESRNSKNSVSSFCLRSHPNIRLYVDIGAANRLIRIRQPWIVTNCEWNDKLIRRAVVYLCQKIKKPILKLTDKDYQDNNLEQLLSLYHSAYNVNIRVFNDLQHTITGWPGGKPSTDDTNRPEKAFPYPKKILLFSPHPDDDVISMGGTFRRLIDQNHDLYVAYQTSGNIAVGDEEAIRYVSLLEDIREKYDKNNFILNEKYNKIINFLLYKKEGSESDISDVLFLKSCIRRQEAISACRYMGLSQEKIRFLNLPFYETGSIKKKQISKKDIVVIKQYLQELKPDRIFVAADLTDPHKTHKKCLDVILIAIEELKNKKWVKNCRIWMYRGAWQEWGIDYIEMAVPISPEELIMKKNAILKHQSQMENAPFLGNDKRLFWQRSEDRNRATADLYRQLGLAEYEAIEAFVQYKI